MFALIECIIMGYVMIIVWAFKIAIYAMTASWLFLAAMTDALVLIFNPNYKAHHDEEKKAARRYEEILQKSKPNLDNPSFKLLSDDPIYMKILCIFDIICSGAVVILVIQSAGGINGNLIQFIWGAIGILKAAVVLILNDRTVKIGLCAIRTAISVVAIFMIGIGMTLVLVFDVLMLLLLLMKKKGQERTGRNETDR